MLCLVLCLVLCLCALSLREKSIANKQEKRELLNYENEKHSFNQIYEEALNPQKPEPQETPNPKPLDEGTRQVKVKIDPEILKQAQEQKARNEVARSRLGIAGETTGRHKLNVDTQAVVV